MQIVKDESGVLKLSGPLEISDAVELQQALRELLDTAAKPVVDLSEVDACDTAALQLLCSARRTAGPSGKPYSVRGVPDAIRQCSEGLGLRLSEIGAEVRDSAVA